MGGQATIEFECPSCHKVTRVPAEYGGRKGKCPKCGVGLEVPKAEDAPAAPAAKADAPAGDRKPCPHCGESVAAVATKCKHCGEWLDRKVAAAREGAEAGDEPPIVLRIWGVGIMGLAALGAAGSVMVMVSGGGAAAGGLIIQIVMFRLGLALFRGKRVGVVGIGILGVLSLAAAVFFLTHRAPVGGAVALAIALLVYGPPVAVGAMNWQRLSST